MKGYSPFPYLEQAFKIERVTTNLSGENMRKEIAYGITSLLPGAADSTRILKLVRSHWRIENSLHWVRDVTFDEDRSQVRTGSGPRVLSTLRNLAISLFRLNGFSNISSGLRKFGWNPECSLRIFGI